MIHTFEEWFLWLMIYSFIGWIYETTLYSIAGKKIVNRGFLNGPICPIYGVGALAVVLALSPFRGKFPLLFLVGGLLTTALEYITSWLMEKLFNARWWDYSNRFLNIHGRVCLLGFVAFGAMSALVVTFVHPWIASLTDSLSASTMHILSISLAVYLTADLTTTLVTVLGIDKRLKTLRETLEQRMEERFPLPRGLHAFQMKRLSNAFPSLRFTRYQEEWQKLRNRLRNRPDK